MRNKTKKVRSRSEGPEEEPVWNYISGEHYEDTFAPGERAALEFADSLEDASPNPPSVSGQWDVICQEIYSKDKKPR